MLFVLGVPGIAWVIALLLIPADMHAEGVLWFYEYLFTATVTVGLLGSIMAGMTAPKAVASASHRRWWTRIGAAVIGALPACRLPTGVVSDESFWTAPGRLSVGFVFALAIVVSIIFVVVYPIAYFVNRYAVWGAIRILGLHPRTRRIGAAIVLAGLAVYATSFIALRERGDLSFQERWYGSYGPDYSIETPVHVRASSRWLEWLYWIPAEIELIVGDPLVTLAPQRQIRTDGKTTRRLRDRPK